MPRYRFENFELRLETGELFRDGKKVRIQPQPVQLLIALLSRAGELVTRQELTKSLWGDTIHTDFEQGLNITAKKLRDALGDSAEQPRLIETLPRRGYRFIGTVRVEDEPVAAVLPGALQPARVKRGRLIRRVCGVGAAGVLLLIGAWWAATGFSRSLKFSPRDTVLVAQFENRTGENDLDGVLEAALEAQLTETPYVAIAPQERVADALRLMRQPVAARVPAELAIEVCQRDAGIKAAIVGVLRKVGNGYQLSAEVLRPQDGRPVISVSENSDNKDEVLWAVKRLSAAIRRRLGDALPESDAKQTSMEKVTTRSLRAAKLYNEANSLMRDRRAAPAEVLLRQAVEEDPAFASAFILLAWAIRNQRPPSATDPFRARKASAAAEVHFMRFAERAMALADTASDREAYFIRGSYYLMQGDDQRAISYYEALLNRYPDHPWVYNNLMALYDFAGEFARSRALANRRIELRPNDPESYLVGVMFSECGTEFDLAQAREHYDRYAELTRQRLGGELDSLAQARMMLHKAGWAWVSGDVGLCRSELDRAARFVAGSGDFLQEHLAGGYLALGQLQVAESLLRGLSSPEAQFRGRMWRALWAGDSGAARKLALKQDEMSPHPHNMIGILRAAETGIAIRMLSRMGTPSSSIKLAAKKVAEGELAFRQNQIGKAIEILTPLVGSPALERIGERYLAADILAQAHVARGAPAMAIDVLERATAERSICGNGFLTAVFRPHSRFALMQLYLKHNRLKEAEAIRQELNRDLQFADQDHILRKQLGQLTHFSEMAK